MYKISQRRKNSDRNFYILSFLMVAITVSILGILIYSIFSKAYTGFVKTEIILEVNADQEMINIIDKAKDYLEINEQLSKYLSSLIVKKLQLSNENLNLEKFFSVASNLKLYHIFKKEKFDQPIYFLASGELDIYVKNYLTHSKKSNFNDNEKNIIDVMIKQNIIIQSFNDYFFKNTDSREPELAGMLGGIIGSILTLSICLLISFPIGVMAALYLEEFAKKSFVNYIIETSINNLSAVPSIIYGILGLAIYINILGVPRSTPLVGGLTLAMMILPTIILAARNALRAIPQPIRDAAIGMGASKMQMIKHHILPLAMPGIMTGTILAIARAMGETAPLIMIGMVSFIVSVPSGIMDPATVMPVQIFIWSDSPEQGFIEKTSAAIVVLLAILFVFNIVAIYIRNKFQHKWE